MATRVELGNLVIDKDRFEAAIDGRRVNLTFVEFDLLGELARSAGKVLSRPQLLKAVWGEDSTDGDRKLTVHMSRLRKKLRGSRPWQIETITKRGYALTDVEAVGEGRPAST
jgi:two-component system alkaline phosphatase synthesis response regulator PhoP